jgi:hypothetical protein
MLDLVIPCVDRPADWRYWCRRSDLWLRLPFLRSLLLIGARRILELGRGGWVSERASDHLLCSDGSLDAAAPRFCKARALLAGAALGQAEILMFLDCDLRIAAGVLRLLYDSCVEGAPQRCLYLARVVESDPRLRTTTFHGHQPILEWHDPDRPVLHLQAWHSFAGRPGFGNLMLPRQLYGQVGGHDPAYDRYGWEDLDLLTRLRLAGADVRPLGQACHRSHTDAQRGLSGLTRRGSTQRMRQVFETKFRALLHHG